MKDIQLTLMSLCKEKSGDRNLATDLADLLHINLDAAYRRIRGTTLLNIEELNMICHHYKVSADAVMNYKSNLVPFQFHAMFKDKFQINKYLTQIAQALHHMVKSGKGEITITAMDIPYFRQFGFKSLSRFKLFFWQKSVLNLEQYRHKKFNAQEEILEYEEIVEQIYFDYHGIDSAEIWASETLDTTFKQVQYYIESGLFDDEHSLQLVCDNLDELLNKLEREAETGRKSALSSAGQRSGKFEMFQSDIYLSNNCVQAKIDDRIYTYVSFNTFNSLMTYDEDFSEESQRWVEQLKSKSILLSEVSEKFRFQFFQKMRQKVNILRKFGKLSSEKEIINYD